MKNKKGQIDLFLVIVFMFILGIMIFAVYLTLTKVNDSGIFDDNEQAQQIQHLGMKSLLNFDNSMLLIIIGLSLFVILSSAFVWNHPAFIILGLVLLAIAITVSGVISNSWVEFTLNPSISVISTSYPKINFLMENLPFYILFMGIAASISSVIGYKRFA